MQYSCALRTGAGTDAGWLGLPVAMASPQWHPSLVPILFPAARIVEHFEIHVMLIDLPLMRGGVLYADVGAVQASNASVFLDLHVLKLPTLYRRLQPPQLNSLVMMFVAIAGFEHPCCTCLLYTSPSPRD